MRESTPSLLKIDFVDFWPSFHKRDNFFYHLLSSKYNVTIDSNEPDVVFGSYGFSHSREIGKYADKKCLKVYYTGESDGPRQSPYDLNITQRRGITDSNHIRMPLWAFFCSWFNENPLVHHRDPSYLVPIKCLEKSRLDIEAIRESKQKFCNFLYADLTSERDKWYQALSTVSYVESAGAARNNVNAKLAGRGDQVYKLAYLSDFLFTLAIENCEVDGYVTEKMIHPMAACSIPIYWGDPNISLDFNLQSVIDTRSLGIDGTIDEVRRLCSSKQAWIEKMSIPWFKNSESCFSPDAVLDFIESGLKR